MAPKIFKRIGRGFLKLCCIKVDVEDQNDPAYGIESMDTPESPEGPPRRMELQGGDYQLITIFRADDPSHENYILNVDDGDNVSSSSSEYFTCDEGSISDESSSGSEYYDSNTAY
ncbi:hypothetical protein HNY73_017599 [Argiope bruennichi]|uniref:Uncharacterized protein n=1 Tax=Argiope bruennichi TaxID=94029 RepID=A0A8T0EDB4_ARGBR|nr:hypothetical protein HNY73_017599 [Argiope bruennichi]